MAAAVEDGRRQSANQRLRLGQLLLGRGWISGEQLLRAVQSQRAVGGRIGTCLLEMNAVSEDRLLDALADQLGVPPIRIDQLRTIAPEVLRLVPSAFAVRYHAVPFAATSGEVSLAALDVDHLSQLDDIAFCSDKRVRPHIANEARLFEALERYYGVECPQRYGHLLDRLNRARYLWNESPGKGEKTPGEDDPLGMPRVTWNRSDEVFGPLGELPRVTAGATVAPLAAAPAPAAAPAALAAAPALTAAPAPLPTGRPMASASEPALAPRSLAEIATELAAQHQAGGIAEVLISCLAGSFVRGGLLRVAGARLRSWQAFGPGLDRERFQALSLSASASATLSAVPAACTPHAGIEPEIAACWRDAGHDGWVVVPIRLKAKTACLMIGQRPQRPHKPQPPPRLLAQLDALAEKAALALELCILRKKILHPSSATEPLTDDDIEH